jgi:uncharacterized protein (DUF427 family)
MAIPVKVVTAAMSDRPHLHPGPDHPITVQPHTGRVTISVGGKTIADTVRAVELHEASYPPRLYVPLDDVDLSLLRASDQHTYCPYKGEASYYDIDLGDQGQLAGAVWYYPQPYDAVADIADTVSFYPERVSISQQD